MKIWRCVYAGVVLLALVLAAGMWTPFGQATAKRAIQVPRFIVDPFWPKPLPSGTHRAGSRG